MRKKFGVRQHRRRVRTPRVNNGSIPRQALPYGRASDTFRLKQLIKALAISLILFTQPIAGFAQRRATATITIDISRPTNRIGPSPALGAGGDGHAQGGY